MGSQLSPEAQDELCRLLDEVAALLAHDATDRSSVRFHLGYRLGLLVEREVSRALEDLLAEERSRLTRPSTN